MNHTALEVALLDRLRGYWRTKASVAAYRGAQTVPFGPKSPVTYAGVPEFGVASGFLAGETLDTALSQLEKHVDERLAADVFFSMVTHMEAFLAAQLATAGLSLDGTFGQLQRRAEAHYRPSGAAVELLDEVRERRNAIVHHGGDLTANYKSAATKVYKLSSGFVPDPALVQDVHVSPGYLSYCVDAMVRYSREYP